MKIKLGYIDEEINSYFYSYKTDCFDIEIIERSDKGLLVYIADPRINDSFWVSADEIMYSSEEVKVGVDYQHENQMTHKERQYWLKTREYREHK